MLTIPCINATISKMEGTTIYTDKLFYLSLSSNTVHGSTRALSYRGAPPHRSQEVKLKTTKSNVN